MDGLPCWVPLSPADPAGTASDFTPSVCAVGLASALPCLSPYCLSPSLPQPLPPLPFPASASRARSVLTGQKRAPPTPHPYLLLPPPHSPSHPPYALTPSPPPPHHWRLSPDADLGSSAWHLIHFPSSSWRQWLLPGPLAAALAVGYASSWWPGPLCSRSQQPQCQESGPLQPAGTGVFSWLPPHFQD